MKMSKNNDLQDYGFTAQTIASICQVSTRTAQRWLANHTRAPQTALKLIRLHATGRVMPPKWPHSWKFDSNGHLDMGYKKVIAWQQVDWYFYSIKCWFQLLELIPRLEARIDALMKVSPSATVIDLQKYKDELKALKNRQFVLPDDLKGFYGIYESEPKQLHRQNGC